MTMIAIVTGGLALFFLGQWFRTRGQHRALQERFKPILDLESERRRVAEELTRARVDAGAAMALEQKKVQEELAKARAEADSSLTAEQKRVETQLAKAKADTERALATEQTRAKEELARIREEAGRVTQAATRAMEDAEARRKQAMEERTRLESGLGRLRQELKSLEEEEVLLSFGFYKPVYALSSVREYEDRLDRLREAQKKMLKDKDAATCSLEWEVNGSKAEGRKQTERTLKLMLRAFNGEADACVAKVTYKNVKAMETRIEKSAAAINGLVEIQRCVISRSYVKLKVEELLLAYEYAEKVQQERDEQRRIREQMREEEAAQRELEKAKLEAEREAQRDAEALAKAKADYDKAKGSEQQRLLERIAELERRVAEDLEKQRAISQAQLTRTGHVYVISNIGSFGEGVFKVGMTRRLVPQDRIDELGDASVPFEFDVHAIIRTSDAPTLETALHKAFADRRVNRINERKEFFRVDLEEIAEAVRKHHGEFELTRVAEAAEYRKSLAIQDEARAGRSTLAA
jgi:multidrug efflux pump subunit AcrA (membrane-fusion protein)